MPGYRKKGPTHVNNKTENNINENYNFRINWTLTAYTTSKKRFTTYFFTT